MANRDGFWRLTHLSDAQLLEGLGGVLRIRHRALAELVAHLAEVEERRLHLEAAYSSMFEYCVERWSMSEDEACRRIELARLARRFPALFSELAGGQITLSVALLLKSVMTPDNHLELLAAARGKCIRQARDLLAERFPKPDAPSSIRKLPERQPTAAADVQQASLLAPLSTSCPSPTSAAARPSASRSSTSSLRAASSSTPELPSANAPAPSPACDSVPSPMLATPCAVDTATPDLATATLAMHDLLSPDAGARSSTPALRLAPRVARSVIEPLSAERYRIQFTADLALKKKLELARDLLRHAHPNGDFAPIVARALDLLLDDLLRCHFGAGARRKRPSPAAAEAARRQPAATSRDHCKSSAPTGAGQVPPSQSATSETADPASSASATGIPSTTATPRRRPHVPRAVRRAVLERDGLGCSWVDEHGKRCGSQAWLQIDHRAPVGKGGSSEPENLRLLCRAHNRLAAEHAYGRAHIERRSLRRKTKHPRDPPA